MVKIDLKFRKLKVQLNINLGEFISIYGKSGSGKTTFLRLIAGLEKGDGFIKVDNKIWQDETTFLSPQKREIGLLFQNYALFPHLSVEKNLLFVKNDKILSEDLLKKTGLFELKNKMPHQLSGGEQQRVALCRALMKQPKILLLDEPFSAIDEDMKNILHQELKTIHKEFNITIIMVSHNQEEIKKLSDKAFKLENGELKEENFQNINGIISSMENNKIVIELKNSDFKIGDKVIIIKESKNG